LVCDRDARISGSTSGINDEFRMTKHEGIPNDKVRNVEDNAHHGFVVRASSLIRHLSFVIRHSIS
jgi:hypothetical protein